jgi:hypothetical protein
MGQSDARRSSNRMAVVAVNLMSGSWRENVPHIVRARRFFIFPTECCERIE